MRVARLLVIVFLLPLSAFAASEDADDWKLIGGVLALVQQIVHQAANSPDSQAARKGLDAGVDAILAGQNRQANGIAAGIMEEVMQDVPLEQRGAFVSIGRDLLTLARREQARAAAPAASAAEASREAALQARRELHAMGLKYWDEQQYSEALKRGDRIAVDLYLAAQGLPAATLPRNPQPAR